MINIENYQELMYCSTLKELSKDNNGNNIDEIYYMTSSEYIAVDFDFVKTKYANNLGFSDHNICSVDALVSKNSISTFIEFKNGKMEPSVKRNVEFKILNSLLILSDITGKGICDTRKQMDFILVFNEEKNKNKIQGNESSKHQIAKFIHRLAEEEFISFGLEKFKGIFFRNVHTYTEKEFETNFVAKLN